MRKIFAAFRSSYAGLPAAAWVLCFASWINRSGSMVLTYLVLFLTEVRGMQPDEAGRLMSVYGIAAIAGAYLGGALCDRIGAKRVILVSLLMTGVLFLVLGGLTSTTAIAAVLAFAGLTNESLRPALLTAASLVGTPEVRTRSLALMRLAANLGVTSGALLGGFLAERDFSWIFIVDGVTCLAAAVVVAMFGRIPFIPRPGAARPRLVPHEPLKDGMFVRALLLMLVLAVVLFQMDSTFALYMRQEYGLGMFEIGTLHAINTVSIVLLEMMLVKRLEKRAPLPLVALGGLLLCLGLGIVPFGRSYAWAAFAMLILTAGEMLWSPFSSSFVASRGNAENRGQYMGCFLLVFAVAYAIAPALGTALYTEVSHDAPWWLVLGLGPIIAIGFLRLARRSPPPDLPAETK